MPRPVRRYYDTIAISLFYNKQYAEKYKEYFPGKTSLDSESYISIFNFEEVCHIFYSKKFGEKNKCTLEEFLNYIKKSCVVLENQYYNAYILFAKKIILFDKMKLMQSSPDGAGLNTKDLLAFCFAIFAEMDEFITFDRDFKIFEEKGKELFNNMKLPKVIILDHIEDK